VDIKVVHHHIKIHIGSKYNILNTYDVPIPIEAWVDYKRKFGHYPSNINIDALNKITITPEESEQCYTTNFASIISYPDQNKTPTLSTCQSAAMNALLKEELFREGKIDIKNIHKDQKSSFVKYLRYKLGF
jgi:1-deoxy-D-xylulose 5-phosphate reductoisomerase